ncbi:hypothetical protein [Geminicoccus harenae]|uniref:hypothetical protein n=1 Tax=Geminicoccus harenae TaxID=2498453 RepID=UPI00168B6579|nr:hypothetical protein [Geminicoccus harenae]
MATAAAQMGHNSGIDAESVIGRLDQDYGDVLTRARDLVEAAGRVPAELDDLTHAKAVDFVAKQIRPHIKRVADIHKAEKQPYLDGGRAVDTWKNGLTADLEGAMKSVVRKIEDRDRKKAAEERARREEEARLAREEAARVAAELAAREAAMKTDDDLSAVLQEEAKTLQAQAAVQAAEKAAAASSADLARTRTSTGSMSTLRTEVAFRVVDKVGALGLVGALLDDEAVARAIRMHIKINGQSLKKSLEKDGPTTVSGVEFFLEERSMIR